jgi:hypothetical protein
MFELGINKFINSLNYWYFARLVKKAIRFFLVSTFIGQIFNNLIQIFDNKKVKTSLLDVLMEIRSIS